MAKKSKCILYLEELGYSSDSGGFDNTQNLLAYQRRYYYFPENYDPCLFDFENAEAKCTADRAISLIKEAVADDWLTGAEKLNDVLTGLRKMYTPNAKKVLNMIHWACRVDDGMPDWIPEDLSFERWVS